MTHIASSGIGKFPYCFSKSSFKVTRAEKIDDLDLIWARLRDRSQLSNPSDLLVLCSITTTQSDISCNEIISLHELLIKAIRLL